AIHVHDLDVARRFYCDLLGSEEGRSAPTWIDVSFFGHQLSLHLGAPFQTGRTGKVGDVMVPMPHFGAVLDLDIWREVAARLEAAGTEFILSPQCRFEGEPGEQWTMFFEDPSGNPIELKGFATREAIFAA
ncbi:MAG: VOC family protein, partial [Pseudomonadota bacterium]